MVASFVIRRPPQDDWLQSRCPPGTIYSNTPLFADLAAAAIAADDLVKYTLPFFDFRVNRNGDWRKNKKLSYGWDSTRYDTISDSGRSTNPNRNPK